MPGRWNLLSIGRESSTHLCLRQTLVATGAVVRFTAHTPPTLMNPDRYYHAALEHVNRVRALRDMDPIDVLPEGKVKSFAGCPIARGVGGIVAGTETCVCAEEATIVVEHDHDVVEFIKRFDLGFYPELDGRIDSEPLRRSEDAEYRDLLRSMATC